MGDSTLTTQIKATFGKLNLTQLQKLKQQVGLANPCLGCVLNQTEAKQQEWLTAATALLPVPSAAPAPAPAPTPAPIPTPTPGK